MRYPEFENILSSPRMSRYLDACNGQTKKTMTLYRLNLELSGELLPVINCFEVALRNAIDKHCKEVFGNEWLLHSASPGGIFDNGHCHAASDIINKALAGLQHTYTHDRLVAALNFGFWRYLFAPAQLPPPEKRFCKFFQPFPPVPQ